MRNSIFLIFVFSRNYFLIRILFHSSRFSEFFLNKQLMLRFITCYCGQLIISNRQFLWSGCLIILLLLADPCSLQYISIRSKYYSKRLLIEKKVCYYFVAVIVKTMPMYIEIELHSKGLVLLK